MWVFLAFTWDASNGLRVSIDNHLIDYSNTSLIAVPAPSPLNTKSGLLMGKDNHQDNGYAKMSVDEVVFFDNAEIDIANLGRCTSYMYFLCVLKRFKKVF